MIGMGFGLSINSNILVCVERIIFLTIILLIGTKNDYFRVGVVFMVKFSGY